MTNRRASDSDGLVSREIDLISGYCDLAGTRYAQRHPVGRTDIDPGSHIMSIRFTIITSTYNAGSLLADTAVSIRNQDYRNIQWIVIDGASTDNTLSVARDCKDVITTLVSEPDSGIYSAWNKALPLIDGHWVLFLGAGDVLHAKDTLARVASLLPSPRGRITLAYGDTLFVDPRTGAKRLSPYVEWHGLARPWVNARPCLPGHPSTFHSQALFRDGAFKFDERCRISSDSELLLTELCRGRGVRIELIVSEFSGGGISSNVDLRLRMILESVYINIKTGVFLKRPFYQLAVVVSNAIKHLTRSLWHGPASR